MTRKHVLIVGEDDLIAWAVRKRFSAMQIPVRIVGTPGEALSEIREGLYGLVVFDPALLEGEDPSILGEFLGGTGVGTPPRIHAPPTGIRFVEKPLNIFDLNRVVEGVIGRYSEKRRDPRYSCNIPMSIFLQEEERDGNGTAWGHPTGVASDASEDGLRVITSHPLVVGQHLQLNPLSVHNPQARFIRRDRVAEVMWIVSDEEGVIAGLRYLD